MDIPASAAVHRMLVPLRWSDFDRFGHMNNAQYVEVAQEARLRFALDEFGRFGQEVPAFFVRHLDVDYLKPVIPDATNKVLVETRVDDIGRSSLTTVQEIKDAQGRIACVVRCVQVAVDVETSTPRAITQQELKVLTAGPAPAQLDE